MSDKLVSEYTVSELMAEIDGAERTVNDNFEEIASRRRHNAKLGSDITLLRNELFARARDGRLHEGAQKKGGRPRRATTGEIAPKKRIPVGTRCCYCGVASSRFVKLEADGPDTFSCINGGQCEDRIRRSNAVQV